MTVPLYLRGEVVGQVLVDEEDIPLLSTRTWRLHAKGYAKASGPGNTTLLMHRLLMGLDKTDRRWVDHINGNRLDNRKTNLRVVPPSVNLQNRAGGYGTSKYRGVRLNGKKFGAFGCFPKKEGEVRGKMVWLGTYADEIEAARVAYDWRAEHHLVNDRDVRP